MTTTFQYNDASFRALFPAFSNVTTFPVVLLQQNFNTAGLYTQNSPDWLVTIGTNLMLLNLMTAHLTQLGIQIAANQSSGVLTQATIDKISVTYQETVLPNQWQTFLASTEYGKQMLALLQVQSVGGFYAPAGLGRAGFSC
jgi:hypothetical protein